MKQFCSHIAFKVLKKILEYSEFIMLKFFVGLLLIAEGMTLSDVCDRTCESDDVPEKFPETEEELQAFCIPGIKYMKCIYEFDEKCRGREPRPEEIELAHRMVATLEEICSEDTLLHAAIVDNLKCLSKLIDDEMKYCPIRLHSPDRIRHYAEALSEEGLVTLTENISDPFTLHECINMMNFFACQSVILERECGAVAMDAFVDILQKIGPGVVLGCENPYDLLPAVIRLHKLEIEKEHSIAEAFRKRK